METTQHSQTISVHMTVHQAEHLLLETFEYGRDIHGRWTSPTGEQFWCTDEALTVALESLNR
jgi:hypothetical protein